MSFGTARQFVDLKKDGLASSASLSTISESFSNVVHSISLVAFNPSDMCNLTLDKVEERNKCNSCVAQNVDWRECISQASHLDYQSTLSWN
mmetsp:Transcript_6326/g.20211  ORF Transcript_6326/g.20211 Transcript_6326/m.20211 type:complete len:91 (+) Transcript_6326:80-352(+)